MELVHMITVICSLITGIAAASVVVTKAVKKIFNPINDKIIQLDKTQCQNYLIDFLADVEQGIAKDESQWEHAHKTYDHYVKDLNGNSYVHSKWERVVKKGS